MKPLLSVNQEANSFLVPFQSWLGAGFTTGYREDGSPGNLAYQPQFPVSEIDRNRRDFCLQMGLEEESFRALKQCHSDRNLIIRNSRESLYLSGEKAPEADALISTEPGLMLSVFSADCVPVLMWDRRNRVVAAVHGGWRGTLARITVKAFQTMSREFNSRAEDVFACIGPAIGPCCYEVGHALIDSFREEFPFHEKIIRKKGAVPFLDLKETHRRSLMELGIAEANIRVSPECSCCGPMGLPSYRKSGASAGRFSAFIFIKEKSTAE